jgi:ABC-2 type transport system ATP-binding protein
MIRPEILVLDEPTSGLDPFVQLEFEHLCEEARDEDRTVFISSHQLPEVEHLCDRVGIIREGRLLAVESIAALKARALRRLEIDFAEPVTAEAFANLPGIRDLTIEDSILRCSVMGSLDALVKAAARYQVTNVRSVETSLEEIFLAYYGSGDGIAGEVSEGKEPGHAAA